jgi:hypothetical protein
MKRIYLSLIVLFCGFWAAAQSDTVMNNDAAAGMRAHGKIYVVMVVAITIVAGLLLYLINLDRKIAKIEKQNS